jgi:hypothetical protein
MKMLITAAAVLIMGLSSFPALAGIYCGAGKITMIAEGYNNSNDFIIFIDKSVEAADATKNVTTNGMIAFPKSSLDLERFRGIKSLCLAAFLAGRNIRVISHSQDCFIADEVNLLK